MDNSSLSSGRISTATMDRNQSTVSQADRNEYEMTLMRLKRLSRVVMCKTEQQRFEAKIQRSNIVRILENHLTYSSTKVRYLALELFCCTIPQLANKTDSLLKPVLPKVFQCLQMREHREVKLKALHFLRAFFRHSKSLSGFIENFVELGIENSNPEVQMTCCLGLNIVFDQDIGNSLYSQLVVPIANILMRKNNTDLVRAAYRSLKHIHRTVKDNRFLALINYAYPEAADLYKTLYNFEKMDSFLSMDNVNINTVAMEYQIKRSFLKLQKDFGILDPELLNDIRQTKNCERARAVGCFAEALKRTSWSNDDLDPNIIDFLKLVNSFIKDSNRLVQLTGFDMLKTVICRMGFQLCPQIDWIVEILREGMISANIKIQRKVLIVVHKLIINIHPMTVIWNLLNTKSTCEKEAVFLLIQDKLSCFPYHEIDMVALCNILGQSLEDANSKLAKCSRDCIILLLDIMRNCPAYGIRTEAVKVLLRNNKLKTETLKDIGIMGNFEEDDYEEAFQSFSDIDSTDQDASTTPIGSTATIFSVAVSHKSKGTMGGSQVRCNYVRNDSALSKSCVTLCESVACQKNENSDVGEKETDANSDVRSEWSIPDNWKIKSTVSANKTTLCTSLESSNASSAKYQPVSSGTESVLSRYIPSAFNVNHEPKVIRDQWACSATPKCSKKFYELKKRESNRYTSSRNMSGKHSLETHNTSQENYFIENESGISQFANVIVSENVDVLHKINARGKPRRYFTRFCVKSDAVNAPIDSAKPAGGDAEICTRKTPLNLPQEAETGRCSRFPTLSHKQKSMQGDVMNRNVYNFNIIKLDHNITHEGVQTIDEAEKGDVKALPSNVDKSIAAENALDFGPYETAEYDMEKEEQMFEIPNEIYQSRNDQTPSEYSVAIPHCERSVSAVSEISKQIQSDPEVTNDTEDDVEARSQIKLEAEHAPENELPHELRTDPVELFLNNELTDDLEKRQPSEALPEPLRLKDLDESVTPFMPKGRQLPRTPVKTKPEYSLEVQIKLPKVCKSNKKKVAIEKNQDKKETGANTHSEDSKVSKQTVDTTVTCSATDSKVCVVEKHNSLSKWGGCQWRRDLEYAAKAAPCSWADLFEKVVQAMKPFPSPDAAETEMKKAVENLYGQSWTKKEEAMLRVIQLAKHHPQVVYENTAKIAVALSNEIKSIRQSVAGKAILTTGYLYEIMGKSLENKLRLIVGALLAKSGNRTLAAYFRLVIKTLFKIINSTSPQKAAMAFIQEGSRQANKAARETAAQFLIILTEELGHENCLVSTLSSQMLKCAALFVNDSSALTRYCGKRMFKVFLNHPEFDKFKDQLLDINTVQNLSKTLEQIKSKGIREEVLPINIID